MGRSGSCESESGNRGGMGGLKMVRKVDPAQRTSRRWDDCSVVGGLCTRQCLALQKAWKGAWLLGKEGKRLGQGEQQETSREGWGWAVHPAGVEVEPEAGLRLWGPAALSRSQGEAASAVWEDAEWQASVFLLPLFYLHVTLLWQERGCGLTRMPGGWELWGSRGGAVT